MGTKTAISRGRVVILNRILLAAACIAASTVAGFAKDVTVILVPVDGKHLDLSLVLEASSDPTVVGGNAKPIANFAVVDGKYVATAKVPKGTLWRCFSVTSKGWYFYNEDFGFGKSGGCNMPKAAKKVNGKNTLELPLEDSYTYLRQK